MISIDELRQSANFFVGMGLGDGLVELCGGHLYDWAQREHEVPINVFYPMHSYLSEQRAIALEEVMHYDSRIARFIKLVPEEGLRLAHGVCESMGSTLDEQPAIVNDGVSPDTVNAVLRGWFEECRDRLRVEVGLDDYPLETPGPLHFDPVIVAKYEEELFHHRLPPYVLAHVSIPDPTLPMSATLLILELLLNRGMGVVVTGDQRFEDIRLDEARRLYEAGMETLARRYGPHRFVRIEKGNTVTRTWTYLQGAASTLAEQSAMWYLFPHRRGRGVYYANTKKMLSLDGVLSKWIEGTDAIVIPAHPDELNVNPRLLTDVICLTVEQLTP